MSNDYEVGYKKPPKATQFKKGQSGNPNGRKKGSKNVSTLINAALDEKVTINASGKLMRISKLEAAFTQQANKAASGDGKAVKMMLDLGETARTREGARAVETAISPEDRRAKDADLFAIIAGRFGGSDE